MENFGGGFSRRDFIKTAASASAIGLACASSLAAPRQTLAAPGRYGPNDRISVALIGLGSRGTALLHEIVEWVKAGSVRLAAVCDVDDKQLEKTAAVAGPQCELYRDYRFILQRRDVDAVIIATPDHWHAVQFVHAAESGKHIYCETPACVTLEEGRIMAAAAKRAKIVNQIGAQSLLQKEAYLAHRFFASGCLGPIKQVRCWAPAGVTQEKPEADGDSPAALDWDLWQGPLRWRSFNSAYVNGGFRWMSESGGGRLGLDGVQLFSCILRWLGHDLAGLKTIEASGVSPRDGLWDAPLEMKATYSFEKPDWKLLWEQPGKPIEPEERNEGEEKIPGADYGAIFECENGDAVVWLRDGELWADRKIREWTPDESAKDALKNVRKSQGYLHDWVNAVWSDAKSPYSIDDALAAADLGILGNLAFSLGRKLRFDGAKNEIVDDEHAHRLTKRPQRYPYYM